MYFIIFMCRYTFYQFNMMNGKDRDWRVTVIVLSTTKVSRRHERALMRFEGKLAGMVAYITSNRSWDVYRAWILHRSRFDDAMRRREGSGKQGWCRLLSGGTPEPPFSVTRWYPRALYSCVAREKVYENEHALSVTTTSTSATQPNCTTYAYYPSPKLFPVLTAKIAPASPASPPQRSLYIIGYFCGSRVSHCSTAL